jgi:hypothetical protein
LPPIARLSRNAPAGNDLDILEPQRLAAARPQHRIFDRASGGAFAGATCGPAGVASQSSPIS